MAKKAWQVHVAVATCNSLVKDQLAAWHQPPIYIASSHSLTIAAHPSTKSFTGAGTAANDDSKHVVINAGCYALPTDDTSSLHGPKLQIPSKSCKILNFVKCTVMTFGFRATSRDMQEAR